MKLRAAAYQFLSRATISNRSLDSRRSSPRQRPEVVYELVVEVKDKPFEMNFAQFPPSRPSIGEHEYVDDEIDVYMSRRWPKCVEFIDTVTIPEDALAEPLVMDLLKFLRLLLWTPNGVDLYDADQRASVRGYRREYFDRQMFDIAGNRRPNSREAYVPTEAGEPAGPGVASLPDVDAFAGINELVWTPILPFPSRQSVADDLPTIRKSVVALKNHYNSYNELQDACRHLEHGEVKAAVRSGASAVDALLRYYCDLWAAGPLPSLPFDEKIEWVLQAAGRPSYRSVEPAKLDSLLYLYRCRNSMHEGDCYFDDRGGVRKNVRSVDPVRRFIDAVEDFVVWVDAL